MSMPAPGTPEPPIDSDSPSRIPYYLLALFAILAGAIAAVTFYFYLDQKSAIEGGARNQLLTIGGMKVRELSSWREERTSDARQILENRITLLALDRVVAGRSGSTELADVVAWMNSLCRRDHYADAILADTAGVPLVSSGQTLGDPGHFRELAEEVMRAGDVVVRDFHRDGPSRPVHLGVNLPLRLGPEQKPFGILFLGIDPTDHVYPLLQSWPLPSKTAETMLVRREGDSVVYLTNPANGAALFFRLPISRTDVAAVQAVLGREGVIEALDYRNVPVFAALQKVPGTPWHLIAKISAAEVRANVVRRSLELGLIAISLILASGAGVAGLWRRQQISAYRQRYQAEVERRALLGQYDYLSRFANDVIILMDDAGQILEINDKAVATYGYKRQELLQMNIRDLRDPGSLADMERQWVITEDRGSLVFETLHRRKNGEALPVEVSSRLVEVAGKKSRQSIIRDITERKQAEADRLHLEQQLAQAQKMETVGRLAGGVAHDFNNLLTIINGYCNLLLAGLPPRDGMREGLEEISRAGDRAAALTSQLLAFSRKQVVEPQTINLNEIIAESTRMVRRLIGDDIEIATTLDPQLSFIAADPAQMMQVLMNLLINSRDAMPDGGRITIETSNVVLDESYAAQHAEVIPGPYVLLAVSDTGDGIGPETLPHVFEPFFTTKGAGVGTGLGLSTVYGIVRQSGGWIWAYSEPGRGATFKLYFPVVGRPEAAVDTSPAHAQPAAGGETVLVVEDQPELRKLTVRILKKIGYEVLDAADGPAALALCEHRETPIHLLITDIVMPGMNGRELAARLLELLPKLRVLYVSGYTADVITHEGVLDADVDFLAKPFSPEQLSAKVRTMLDRAAVRRNVLVIDDEEPVRVLLRKILGQAGYRVLEAPNGKVGAEMVTHNHVDAVVTDLVMPEQEGLETLRILRRDHPAVKLIAISGAFEGQYLKTAESLGALGTLRKPIVAEQLLQMLRRLLAD